VVNIGAKRKSRSKPELEVVRPWQNRIMATFLKETIQEGGKGYALKSTVLRKLNEYAVPITWNRVAPFKIFYETKSVYPPWAPSKKVTLMIPLRDDETNIRMVEETIIEIITEKIEKDQEKFKLPIRLADI